MIAWLKHRWHQARHGHQTVPGPYPYPALLSRFQPLTPADYQTWLATVPAWQQGVQALPPPTTHPAWDLLPVVPYARCPFCACLLQDSLNLTSLLGWRGLLEPAPRPYRPAPDSQLRLGSVVEAAGTPRERRVAVPVADPPPEAHLPCPHALGVVVFLNLHGHGPGYRHFRNRHTEVPYVMPWVLAHPTIRGAAVLSAVPIGRPAGATVEPTFTAVLVSYFSAERAAHVAAYWAQEQAWYGHDREWYPTLWDVRRRNPTHPGHYDLAGWAAAGQLGWLDHTDPGLPVHLGAGTELPHLYTTMRGDRDGAAYDDG